MVGATTTVYPRVYGETLPTLYVFPQDKGLSPRVRGNRLQLRVDEPRPRSIPACTGKPQWRAPRPSVKRVYPRVYGETESTPPAIWMSTGLSPRVRGNPPPTRQSWPWRRSIPACTGKPLGPVVLPILQEVYPRVYGETLLDEVTLMPKEGLSPRVRGNRIRLVLALHEAGSIPACTGKPTSAPQLSAEPPVYPRVYGETIHGTVDTTTGYGLSPRVRGNP